MNACFRLTTKPCPQTGPGVIVVLVVLIVVAAFLVRSGCNLPDLMTCFFLSAGVARIVRPVAAVTSRGGR